MWAWKFGRSFLDDILRANVIHSKSVLLVSAYVNILLIKYIGRCLSSPSDCTKAPLTAVAKAAIYKKSS